MNGVYTMLGPEGFGSYRWEDGRTTRVSEPPRALVTPGFVDIHIHGAFGIDFMSATKADMETLCKRLAANGYEYFLPTTVTETPEAVSAALANLPDHPMILGFHLEGPFISPKFPGAQPPDKIAAIPDGPSAWDSILGDPRLKVITLAPEIPGALEFILKFQHRPVRVSLGHSDATFEEARRAFEFGASHTTHTFNAMRGFHHREAGLTGYALANADLEAELIYDRNHVCKEAAQLLFKCKHEDSVIAVSDSTAATGMVPGSSLNMWGHECEVGRHEVRLKSNDALAGSAITLLEAFQNLAEDFGPETAIRACCHNPRLALGLDAPPAVWLEWNSRFELQAVHVLNDAAA